eukprot:236039_1
MKHINIIVQCVDKLNQLSNNTQIKSGIDTMQTFAIDINNFIDSILPNKEEIIIRNSMYKYIVCRVSELEKMRTVKYHLSSSELWNVSCRGSDIDIAITVSNYRCRVLSCSRRFKQELLDDLLQIIFNNNKKKKV